MGIAIKVENLVKTFSSLQKQPGIIASLKSLFAPQYEQKIAVDNISFQVAKGDCVAFIGPNGAGKSTTIKIVTGILHPAAGTVSILGLDPDKDRMELAFKIGTVFGQKSQLWYHLPPIDTFQLLCHIYELKPSEFNARLDFLVKKFEIEHIIKTPVRKLSLGERMRCELVGSLLHRPQVLFLDEPTIGLDVIAKQQMRDLLEFLNKQEGVTIFLTSHDVGDIEHLARRTIIVNHGKIVFDDVTEKLKTAISSSKVIDLVLEESTDTFSFSAGSILERTPHSIKIQIDASIASTEQLLAYALEHFTIVDITINDTPLEQIITQIYQSELQ
jgi:ABC-2 type transport system ATP-binding protein